LYVEREQLLFTKRISHIYRRFHHSLQKSAKFIESVKNSRRRTRHRRLTVSRLWFCIKRKVTRDPLLVGYVPRRRLAANTFSLVSIDCIITPRQVRLFRPDESKVRLIADLKHTCLRVDGAGLMNDCRKKRLRLARFTIAHSETPGFTCFDCDSRERSAVSTRNMNRR